MGAFVEFETADVVSGKTSPDMVDGVIVGVLLTVEFTTWVDGLLMVLKFCGMFSDEVAVFCT